jgi:hypothetical protein
VGRVAICLTNPTCPATHRRSCTSAKGRFTGTKVLCFASANVQLLTQLLLTRRALSATRRHLALLVNSLAYLTSTRPISFGPVLQEYIFIYTYIYVYTYICVYMHIYIHIHTYVYMITYMCIYMIYTYTHAYIYVYTYVLIVFFMDIPVLQAV